MKLLMITQKVDKSDTILAFAYRWIKELDKHVEKLIVICLRKADDIFLNNTDIYAIKRGNISKLLTVYNFIKFSYYAIYRRKVDLIFVHQCPIYILLIYPLVIFRRIPIALWYAHGHVSISLRIASKIASIILTSTKEGCRLKSSKIKVVGQGIDVEQFLGNTREGVREDDRWEGLRNKIGACLGDRILLSVGRIAPVKDYLTLIKAVEYLLKEKNMNNIKLIIVGDPLDKKDNKYMRWIKDKIIDLDLDSYIKLIGAMPNDKIADIYLISDIFVSASRTGSLDKVILEAMASRKPVITSLPLEDLFGDYSFMLKYKEGDYKELGEKIYNILNLENGELCKLKDYLREVVIERHSVQKLIRNIIEEFNTLI